MTDKFFALAGVFVPIFHVFFEYSSTPESKRYGGVKNE